MTSLQSCPLVSEAACLPGMQPPCSIFLLLANLLCLQVAAKDAELRALKQKLALHLAHSAEQDGFVAALLDDHAAIVQQCTTAEQQVRSFMFHRYTKDPHMTAPWSLRDVGATQTEACRTPAWRTTCDTLRLSRVATPLCSAPLCDLILPPQPLCAP